MNPDALAARLEQLAQDARQKAEKADIQEHAAYWLGAVFGLETAAAELRRADESQKRRLQ